MSTSSDGLVFGLDGETGSVAMTVLDPGEDTPFVADDWRGCLIMVQSGALRLTCRSGRTAIFNAGSLLYLDGLELTSVGSGFADVTVLLTIRPSKRISTGPAA